MHAFGSPAESTSSTPAAAPAHRPCVLVVDPNASARSVLEVALARDGFDVWSTTSGADGVALLSTRMPDMVVLESNLGAEDGFSFVAQLRGDHRMSKLPVLLLVDGANPSAAGLAEVVGADDVLAKPAYARDIGALVRLELATRDEQGRSVLHTGQVDPAHVVRALLSIRRSARVELAGGRAVFELRDGAIVSANCGQSSGLDAVVRALVLAQGAYTVETGRPEVVASMRCELREYVHVVLPRLHDWSLEVHQVGSLDARLGVNFSKLATELAGMPDEVNRLVRLFDGRRTVREVLTEAPFSETLALEVTARLRTLGVVAPMADHDAVTKVAPKLFEPRPIEALERMEQLFEGSAPAPAVVEAATTSPSADWFEGVTPAATTEAADGGWATTTLAGVNEALAKQLSAFNVQTVVEPRATPESHRSTASFARGTLPPSTESLIQALEERQVQQPILLDQPASEDRQARIVTPTMVPAIQLTEEMAAAKAAVAVEAAAATGPSDVSALEAAFFGTSQEVAAPEVPVVIASNRSALAFVAVVLAVLGLAVFVEWSAKKPAVVEGAVAPKVEKTAAAPVDEAVPETVVDVAAPLADAKAMYDQGRFSEAASVLEQVVADAPKSVPAWLLLGLAQYDANRPAAAKTAVDRVLALDPNNARVQILVATLAFDAGDVPSARAALEKYLALEPNGASADEARALLAR